ATDAHQIVGAEHDPSAVALRGLGGEIAVGDHEAAGLDGLALHAEGRIGPGRAEGDIAAVTAEGCRGNGSVADEQVARGPEDEIPALTLARNAAIAHVDGGA